MDTRPYNFGVIIGRFQHIHLGHMNLINHGIRVCKNLLVLVSSAQESGTFHNPFDVTFRIELIRELYPHTKLGFIDDMDDLSNNGTEWGRYVLDQVKKWGYIHGVYDSPDVIIHGSDTEYVDWFDPEDTKGIVQLIVPSSEVKVSDVEVRELLVRGDMLGWRQKAGYGLHDRYHDIRKKLSKVPAYREMMEQYGQPS